MKLKALLSSLLLAVGGCTVLLSEPLPAQAYTVTFNGKTGGDNNLQLRDIGLDSRFDIGRTLDPTTWALSSGGSLSQDLSGSATIQVLNLTSSVLSLAITVANNVDPSFQSSIVSLGFGVTPNPSSAGLSDSGDVFDTVTVQSGNNQNFPGGFKNIDICIFGANNCSGGNINQGLLSGESDTFIVNIFSSNNGFLSADGTYATVTLSDFASKWQTQDGSYELAGVPEPFTMAGSGVALGLGALMKRKAAKQKEKQKEKAIA